MKFRWIYMAAVSLMTLALLLRPEAETADTASDRRVKKATVAGGCFW